MNGIENSESPDLNVSLKPKLIKGQQFLRFYNSKKYFKKLPLLPQ